MTSDPARPTTEEQWRYTDVKLDADDQCPLHPYPDFVPDCWPCFLADSLSVPSSLEPVEEPRP